MRGVGLTMEGIENNPVMYELVCDLPWSTADGNHIVWRDWLSRYLQTRYGNVTNPKVSEAWLLLARSIYGCPADNVSQGCRESCSAHARRSTPSGCRRGQRRSTTTSPSA